MKEFQIDEFQLNKNYCIEASAGTGKTFTIKNIVVKLVKAGIPLEKILLVTYTEKAAGELRNRIRKALSEESAQELSDEEKKRVAKALGGIDSATIGTIHSFCQKTLRDFAYEAGAPFALDMVTEDLSLHLIDKNIRDKWSQEIVQNHLEVKVVRSIMDGALQKMDGEWKWDPWLEKYDSWFEKWNRLQQYRKKEYKAFTSQNIKDPAKAKTFPVDGLIESILNASATATTVGSKLLQADSPELQELLEFFLNQKGFSKKDALRNVFVRAHFESVKEEFQKQKELNRVQSFNDMILQVRKAVVSTENAATPLCQKLREQYRYAIVDEFQDTNQAQWDIFKTVFLDSDKNNIIVVGDPKQSIYSFQGADLNVYLNAKQAIAKKGEKLVLKTNYRSTDSMVNFCNELFSGDFFKNSSEASSSPSSDSFAFQKSDCSKKIKEPAWNGKECPAVFVAQTSETEAPKRDSEEFARYAVTKIVELMKEDESGKTALQYYNKDAQAFVNVKFSDIAVLARTRTEMENMEKAMKDAGIPFVRYKDSNLFKGREVQQWIALLCAIDTPDFSGANRKFLNAALVSDFFRFDFGTVKNEIFDNPNNPEIRKFKRWRNLVKRRWFAELQESIYAETEIDKYLCDYSKLQSLAKIKQIGAYVFDYLYQNRIGLEEVINHLKGLSIDSENADDEDGNLVSKGSDTLDAVQVMTIHSSKGLQFPVVISVAGFKGLRNDQLPPFVYREKEDDKVFGLTKDAKEERKVEELEEWRRLFYVDFTRAESVLILPYYTNIWSDKRNSNEKNFSFLKNALENVKSFTQFEDLSGMSLLSGWKTKSRKLKETVKKLEKMQENDEESSAEHIRKINNSIAEKIISQHSYSSLSGKMDRNNYSVEGKMWNAEDEESFGIETKKWVKEIDASPVRFLLEEDPVVEENALPEREHYPKGNRLGNALHQMFEEMDFERIGNLENSTIAMEDDSLLNLVKRQFESQAFNVKNHPDWIRQSACFAWNTMNAELPEIHGSDWTKQMFSLKTLKTSDRVAEMSFHLNAGESEALKNYCKGFMDLLFKRGEYYSILDWKSDVLENYNAEGTQEKVDSEYAVQRVLYAYCLMRWLKTFYPEKSEEEIFNQHFGGVYYVFVRGCRSGKSSGLYAQTWNSFAALKKAFEQVELLMGGQENF